MEEVIEYAYKKDGYEIKPCNKLVKSWVFKEGEEKEAILAHYMGEVAEKNGLDSNDMMHLYPALLRVLKSKSEWAK